MRSHSIQRRLAALFSADVKGYSRLMGDDEVETVRTLIASREVMTARILQYGGRVVDAPGDNLLAEFTSVVDAVQCAVDIQQELTTRNAALPLHRRMEFRIGINLGDVLVEDERLYGDGVNITARIEELAEAGGICLSGTAYDQIDTKLALSCVYFGEHTVKNITKPVRVYRVVLEGDTACSPERPAHRVPQQRRPWMALAVALGLLLVGSGAVAVWYEAVLGHGLRLTAQHAAAIASYTRYRDRDPDSVFPHVFLALSYSQAGRLTEAQAAMAEALQRDPTFSLERWAQAFPYKKRADLERELEALRQTGLQ